MKKEKYEGEEWTEQETDRQDRVDNAIAELIKEVTPIGYFDWDMEVIGEVRDVIMEYVVNKKQWMTEQQFYPYRVLLEPKKKEETKNIILQPFKGLIVTDEQLVKALEKAIEDMDADELAHIAGETLGGKCWYLNDATYSFEPDDNYYGAFNFG